MIVFCCQSYTICLIDQAQRGFLFFLTVNQGFEAKDQNGKNIRLSDFAGKKLFLYFYPKANTSA